MTCTSFIQFIVKYFILLDATINGSIILIYFWIFIASECRFLLIHIVMFQMHHIGFTISLSLSM